MFIAESKIDSVREAVDFCKTQPIAAANRYVVVDDAHRLVESAQDAYLKLLEEPGEHSCVIFIVSDAGLLQSAIRSRFRATLRWKPLNLIEMRNFAIAFGSGEDSKALTLCGGRPGLFSSMFEDEGGTKHAELYDILMRAFDGKSNLLLDPVPEVVKEAKEPIQRECIAHVCREAALTIMKFKKAPFNHISALLKFSALMVSLPSASAELHWFRMASCLM